MRLLHLGCDFSLGLEYIQMQLETFTERGAATSAATESQFDQEAIELLWKSPKYKFRVAHLDGSDGLLKEISIDVTGSAPTFVEPSQYMSDALDRALHLISNISAPRILDVGAGKLRTTIYILNKNNRSKLWAVEYEQLRTATDQARDMYTKAESFKSRFNSVVFPHQFIKLTGSFDLAIVANVLGTMPVPAERLVLLQYCYQRVKNNGYLLWYSQHNEGDYREGGKRCNQTTRLGDGYHVGDLRYRKFYRDIPPEEVDQLLLSAGFRFEESISSGHNIARIYKKSSVNLFKSVLKAGEISAICNGGSKIPEPKGTEIKTVQQSSAAPVVIPNPEEFTLEKICIKRLSNLGLGAAYATDFHRVTELILMRVFQNSLRKFVIEQEINEKTKRVDIVCKNFAEDGFFRRLDSHYHIPSPNVFIECKNYTSDPANPEVDQIANQLKKERGMFALLIYRTCGNRALLRKRLTHFISEGKYIVDLEEKDLIQLLEWRLEGADSAINDFMEERLDLLTLQPE